MSSPTRRVRANVAALLKAHIPEIAIHDCFPHMQVTPPCIVMQQTYGSTRELGMGEVKDTAFKGHKVRLIFQFDVYHEDPKRRDDLADRILFELWRNRHILRQVGVSFEPAYRIADMPSEEVGARIYRKSIDIPFEVQMTAPLS